MARALLFSGCLIFWGLLALWGAPDIVWPIGDFVWVVGWIATGIGVAFMCLQLLFIITAED